MPEPALLLLVCLVLAAARLLQVLLRYALAFYVVHKTGDPSAVLHLVPFERTQRLVELPNRPRRQRE